MLHPSRTVVLALASYVALALAATLALGDLGDVGFWIVWVPLLGIVLYLAAAGLARLAAHASSRPGRAS